jgi:hypothetical protein
MNRSSLRRIAVVGRMAGVAGWAAVLTSCAVYGYQPLYPDSQGIYAPYAYGPTYYGPPLIYGPPVYGPPVYGTFGVFVFNHGGHSHHGENWHGWPHGGGYGWSHGGGYSHGGHVH